ncbi:MAG: hypothetical protein ABSG94_08355 [Brevinematales bacterium]|jgi:hypothetical protein
MKKIILILPLLLFLSAGAYGGISLVPDTNDSAGRKYILTSETGGRSISKDTYLVGTGLAEISRIVYIFHGYRNSNDTYRQNPSNFIINWDLSGLSDKYGILFVMVDNGTSVYPVTKLDDPLSDMSMMNELKKEIDGRYKAVKPPLSIGFSAGVEGAVKFAILNDIKEIMAISGNYDLYSIPPNEMAFHVKDFGKGSDIIEKENPITLLRKSHETIYLFCEEKNRVNVKQAQALVNADIPGVKLIDLRALGKGYSHDWTFLTSPGITRNLEKIISGDVDNLDKIQETK